MRKAYPEDQYLSRSSNQIPSSPTSTPTSEYIKMDESYNATIPYSTMPHNGHDQSPISYYTSPPPPPTFNGSDHHRFNFSYEGNHNDDVQEFQCLKCGIIFSRESDLHIHYTQDHGFGQNGGGSSASSNSSASGNHSSNKMHRSTNQDMFCDKCQLRFHCLLSFRVHQHEHVLPNVQPHYPMSNSHLLSLSYTCDICGANFMSRESLTDHANAHLYEHVCSESTCGESDGATTNSSEGGYYSQHHYQQRNYIDHANIPSDNIENSSRHMTPQPHHQHIPHHFGSKSDDNLIVNQGPNVYSPEYSSSSYHHEITTPVPPSSKTSGIYEPLIVMDNGKRRFKCVVCNKFLSSRIAHEEHTRGKHTGDKPYSCSFCGKRFAVWNTYKHHMSTHKGGITPLQKCGLCEKRFKTADCLRTHMQREHNYQGGEDGITGAVDGNDVNAKCPYICQLCGKGFLRKMWRTRHYLSHAGQNCFRCELCSCILPDEQSYRLHHETHKVSN